MALQQREFLSWLDDVERLRLYSQFFISKNQALGASLAKAESKLQHWKQEAKAGVEKIERVEKEKDKTKQEAKVARLVASEGKARAKDELIRVRDALVVTDVDRRGLEVEVSCLSVEQTSLLLELEASRDEVSTLHSQVGKDKEAMVEDYQKAL